MAVGLALFETENDILININKFEEFYKKYDLNFMPSFIQEESNIYLGSGYLIYDVDEFAITVFTDLTERAPTFNLRAFERDISGDITGVSAKGNSLCYVHIKGAHNIEESWRLLLNREPHCLDWPEHSKMTTKTYMQGFDFSSTVFDNRLNRTGNENQIFKILMQDKNKVKLELGKQSHTMGLTGQGILYDHLLLKMILNIHSTLIMGILGRYENNVMSWVKPTNGKLIDRSARYVAKILQAKNIEPSYEEIVCAIFKNMDQVGNQQSIVLMVVDEFKPQ